MSMNDRMLVSNAAGANALQSRCTDQESSFQHQRSMAKNALIEIGVVLAALTSRLDAAVSGEEVDATPAVNQIRELIWAYNNAAECAREAWLRHHLSAAHNEQLLAIDTPMIFGLPWFVDEAQERRAMLQGVEISRRLNCRNELLDRIVAAANVLPLSTQVAGVGLGGGSYLEIRRRDQKWSLVKTIASKAPRVATEIHRACDVKLAAALIRFMLRKESTALGD
jgi:hypothetical protein